MPLLGDDLLATLVGLGGGPAGLDGVLLGGVALGRLRLDDAGDREAAAGALVEDLVGMGLSDRVASLARVVADELVDQRARTRPRPTAAAAPGRSSWPGAADARYLGIEVRDPWGSLDLAALGPRLASRVRGGGAAPDDGLGFGLVHACCQRLSITVEAGRQTRAVAVLDLRHRATSLARAGSVHLSAGSTPPRRGRRAAGIPFPTSVRRARVRAVTPPRLPEHLQPSDTFARRHLGPSDADVGAMLAALGYRSTEALVADTIPAGIRLGRAARPRRRRSASTS